MAIVVKHGLVGASAVSGFAQGQAKRAMESARFTSPKDRRSIGPSRATGRRGYSSREGNGNLLKEPSKEPSKPRYSGWAPRAMALKAMDEGQPNVARNIMADIQPTREDGSSQRVEKKLTSKQREQFNALSEAYQEAVDSGDYTEEELIEIKRRVDAKKMGISPIERVEEQEFPEGQGVGQVWEQAGKMLTRTANGEVKAIADVTTDDMSDPYADFDYDKETSQARVDLVNQGVENPSQQELEETARQKHEARKNFEARLRGRPEPFPNSGGNTESVVPEPEDEGGSMLSDAASGAVDFVQKLVNGVGKAGKKAVEKVTKSKGDDFDDMWNEVEGKKKRDDNKA